MLFCVDFNWVKIVFEDLNDIKMEIINGLEFVFVGVVDVGIVFGIVIVVVELFGFGMVLIGVVCGNF